MMIVAIEPPTAAAPRRAAPPNIPAPVPACLPFSIISARASPISWRTRSETSRERSLTSSETDSCRFSASPSRILTAVFSCPRRGAGEHVAGSTGRRRPGCFAVALVARRIGVRLVTAPTRRLQRTGKREPDEQANTRDHPWLTPREVLDIGKQLLRLHLLQVAADP